MGYKGILMLDSILIASGLGIAIGVPVALAVIIGFGLVGFGVATIIPYRLYIIGKNQNNGYEYRTCCCEYGWIYRLFDWSTGNWFCCA
jgi:hypothetical protein